MFARCKHPAHEVFGTPTCLLRESEGIPEAWSLSLLGFRMMGDKELPERATGEQAKPYALRCRAQGRFACSMAHSLPFYLAGQVVAPSDLAGLISPIAQHACTAKGVDTSCPKVVTEQARGAGVEDSLLLHHFALVLVLEPESLVLHILQAHKEIKQAPSLRPTPVLALRS